MPVTLVTGPANAGKAHVVIDAVRGHLAHGRAPLLIVPTRADIEHYTRELAGEHALMGMRVESFEGLIGEAVRRAGIEQPVLGAVARTRVLEALSQRAGAPTSPGVLRALGELIAELQVRRVSAARLHQALSSWAAGDGVTPLAQLGRLYGDYRATLERLGRLDSEQCAVRALDELRMRPAAWADTPVLFYGFDDLTSLQLDAIETLGRVVDADVMVSLAYEQGRTAFAGRAASFHALAPLAGDRHRELAAQAEHYDPHARVALSHLERRLFEAQAERVEPEMAVRLLEGGGERAELELIVAEILALLDSGMAADEIAVLVRPLGTDLDLLEEVFSAWGVPFALRRGIAFRDTAIGRALLGLLRCVPARDGSCAGELADLLAWLRAPGVLDRPELADRLESTARRQGVAGATRARALWEQRNWPLDAVERMTQAQSRGAGALIEQAVHELHWLFCAPRRADAHVLDGPELADAGALAAGRRALSELRELAMGPGGLAPGEAAELARVLERVEVFQGEPAAPGAVSVLDPLALRARRVGVLFACGLQEGVFPARARAQHPLLDDEQRRGLAESSGLMLGAPEDVLAAERYLLYAALSRPEKQLFLSWHVADDDGQATPRSLFVDDVCDLYASSLSSARVRRPLGAVDAMSMQTPTIAADRPGPLRDERLLEELREHVWSASSLERWIGCPVAWFVERMLRPNAFDPDPEPLVRGGLAHAALKDTLQALREETGSARLTGSTLGRATELLRQALADGERSHPLSVVPERAATARRRLLADLERYLEYAAQADSPLEPTALEIGFGFAEDDERGEGSGLPALELSGGLRLRGRIDRVDVASDGSAVVYDYKGRQAPPAARWIRDGNLQVALYMRAVEDLLDLRVVGGFYQPLSGEDLRARGVLDGDGGVQLDTVRTDVLDHSDTQSLLVETLAAAEQAAEQAGRGELEPRPQTCAFRGGCMYPTICRCERR